MRENHPSRAECEEDESDSDHDLAPFAPVLAVVRLNAVPEAASKIWNSRHPHDRLARPPVVARAPLHGSYNILFPVDFTCRGIGIRWLLKIPINGTPTHWDALSANQLESEARTMQLIRQRTSIPIPEVFGFCNTLDNPLHCPHIWLSFIPGISLDDFWLANLKSPEISEEDCHRCRTRLLNDIASAMVQLDQFSFQMGGLLFNGAGEPVGVGRRRELDIYASAERQMDDSPDYMPVYFASGPFRTAKEFYTSALKRENPAPSDSEFLLGQRRLLDIFVSCVTDFFTADACSFVLTHPDFDIQNFLVSPEGRLVGILDWDGVGAWPKSLGNRRYPGWLTRDWDPGMYGYGSNAVRRDPEMREDSPQTLARYRKVYQDAIRDALGEQKGQQVGTESAYYTSATLITENLAIAASDQMSRGNILRKILREIAAVVEVPCSDQHNLLYLELCKSLGQGELKKETLEALRTGLDMLLQNKSL